MSLRASVLLIPLFAIAACPQSSGDTAADPDSTGTTDGTSSTGDEPTTSTTGTANTPPTAPTVAIAPVSPTPLDDLTCSVTAESTDADGDAVSYTFAWTRDGVDAGLATGTVPAAELDVGQEWQCTVTPSDGVDEGPSAAAKVTIGAAPVILETCAEVKADQPGATDGVYTLYVGKDPNKPWMAHCQDMDAVPREYLPLVNVQDGYNFSHYTAGGGSPGTNVDTHFTHLRIDPITLIVDIDDLTFSSSTGELMHGAGAVTSLPYAIAEGCSGELDSQANVDLVGTPFKLKDPFCSGGFEPLGGAVLDMNNQVAHLTAGGFCGWTGPTKEAGCVDNPQGKNSGFVLDLEYMQADAYDQAAQTYCENNLQCLPGVFPDLATCIAEWQGYKTDDPNCNAAYAAANNCLATQSCDDLALSVHQSMFGDCSDEVMAKKTACP